MGRKLGYLPHGTGIAAPFDVLFDEVVDVTKHGVKGCDAIILWGGEDISPVYYADKPHPMTQQQGGPSNRDRCEWRAMNHAKMLGIPIIGICRGAQFLCVFSGGRLVQHVTGHHVDHGVMCSGTASSGEVIITSSCHHQMMMPYNLKGTDYQLLAWASPARSTTYEVGDGKIASIMHQRLEPEAILFHNTKGLAIQGHPEWMNADAPYVRKCIEWAEKLLNNGVDALPLDDEEALV